MLIGMESLASDSPATPKELRSQAEEIEAESAVFARAAKNYADTAATYRRLADEIEAEQSSV